MKDTLINTLLFIVAIAVIAGATWYVSPNASIDEREELRILSERNILSYAVEEDIFGSIVSYSYKGEKLPEKLSEDEIVEMRTESSYTRQIGIENKGTSDEKVILELVSYSNDTFLKEGGLWYYIEHDVVPKKVFDKVIEDIQLSSWLIPIAHADYTVINEQHFSGSGDGRVYHSGAGIWGTTHDATSGTGVDYTTSTSQQVRSSNTYDAKTGSDFTISRIFLPFDTSSIKSTATITSAKLYVYVSSKSNSNIDAYDYITVVQTTQAASTSLVVADYDNIGTTDGVNTPESSYDITDISTSAYLAFTLNSTGLGWIKKSGDASVCPVSDTGVTCLGLREGHDIDNVAPGPNVSEIITIGTSESANDPYLSVTYEVKNFAPWMFHAF